MEAPTRAARGTLGCGSTRTHAAGMAVLVGRDVRPPVLDRQAGGARALRSFARPWPHDLRVPAAGPGPARLSPGTDRVAAGLEGPGRRVRAGRLLRGPRRPGPSGHGRGARPAPEHALACARAASHRAAGSR